MTTVEINRRIPNPLVKLMDLSPGEYFVDSNNDLGFIPNICGIIKTTFTYPDEIVVCFLTSNESSASEIITLNKELLVTKIDSLQISF